MSPELWGNIASYLPPQQACHLLIAGSIAQRKGSSCLSTVASPTDLEVRAFFDVNQIPIDKLPIGLMPSVLKGIRDVCNTIPKK